MTYFCRECQRLIPDGQEAMKYRVHPHNSKRKNIISSMAYHERCVPADSRFIFDTSEEAEAHLITRTLLKGQ